MKRFFTLLIFICLVFSVNAQDKTIKPFEQEDFKPFKPNPLQAMTYSAFIPAGGQIYNKAYTKAALFLYLDVLTIERIAYFDKKMEKIDMASDSITQQEKDDYEDYYEKRQNYYGWLVFSFLYSIMDAYVDAKLYDFDTRKRKIRMNFEPDKVSLIYEF